jgi:cAMP-specific phosphodiesterase 4
VPTLKVEDTDILVKKEFSEKKDGEHAPLSQISGVRKLKHTNSFTGVVPKYGVESSNEEELTKVCIVCLIIL